MSLKYEPYESMRLKHERWAVHPDIGGGDAARGGVGVDDRAPVRPQP